MGALTRSLHLFSFQRSSIFTSQSSIFLFSGGARKDLIISNHSHVFFGIVEAREPQLLHRGTISIEKHASIPKSFCKSKHITEHTLKDMFAQARTLELSFTAITKFIQVKNQGIYLEKKKTLPTAKSSRSSYGYSVQQTPRCHWLVLLDFCMSSSFRALLPAFLRFTQTYNVGSRP